jgi:hypothetical protein
VTFSVYRSPDAFKAFEAAGKVLQGLADGSVRSSYCVIIICADDSVTHHCRLNLTPMSWMPRRVPCRTHLRDEKATLVLRYVLRSTFADRD